MAPCCRPRWASARSRRRLWWPQGNAPLWTLRLRRQWRGRLGCGVMAGLGAALDTGNVGRGDSVAVFGCGGVGDAAIVDAALAGATTIVAVDIDDHRITTWDHP